MSGSQQGSQQAGGGGGSKVGTHWHPIAGDVAPRSSQSPPSLPFPQTSLELSVPGTQRTRENFRAFDRPLTARPAAYSSRTSLSGRSRSSSS